jgi:RHS repeat-associated protein
LIRSYTYGASRAGEPSALPTDYAFTRQKLDRSTGLMSYGARYYDPALGHFLSPDTVVPDPGNALDYHRYAYVRFNPLQYTDPSGHCPTPPASLGPTLCMALFIQPSTIAAGPITVRGDGRGFSSASDPTASRSFIWIPVAEPQHFHAQMNPSGYPVPIPLSVSTSVKGPVAHVPVTVEWTHYFPPSAENRWEVREVNGTIEVSYDVVISGPLEGIAPRLNGTVRFTPNASGSYDYSFERDGFPWAEAYYHDSTSQVHTIFRDPAVRGNPHDLFAIEHNPGLVQGVVRFIGRIGFGQPRVSIKSSHDACRPGVPC